MFDIKLLREHLRNCPAQLKEQLGSGSPGEMQVRVTKGHKIARAIEQQYNLQQGSVPPKQPTQTHTEYADAVHDQHGHVIGDKNKFTDFVADTHQQLTYDS